MPNKTYTTCAVCDKPKDADHYTVCLKCYTAAQEQAQRELQTSESIELNKGIKNKLEKEAQNGQKKD